MFGTNPIRKQDLRFPENLRVQEVFGTIQGEGPLQGISAVFVRLWGCNLKCFWCDTDFESSVWVLNIDMLAKHIALAFDEMGHQYLPHEHGLVVITGGEPFRQDLTELLYKCRQRGWRVQIETNGTLWIEGLETFIEEGLVTLVCSPKTGKVHESVRAFCHDWKYIVCAETASPVDGLPMASTQVEHKPNHIARPNRGPKDTVWVQPLDMDHVDSSITERNTRHACDIAMRYGYRLCIQQHKVVGLP